MRKLTKFIFYFLFGFNEYEGSLFIFKLTDVSSKLWHIFPRFMKYFLRLKTPT